MQEKLATPELLLKSIATSTATKQLENGLSDIEFRDQVLTYLQFYENNMNQKLCKNYIDLQEVAEQSYDFMEAYI
jgi:hypothetical protein